MIVFFLLLWPLLRFARNQIQQIAETVLIQLMEKAPISAAIHFKSDFLNFN